MKFLAIGLRVLAALFRLLPCKRRVAMLSRQSAHVSLDFQMLADALRARLGTDAVIVHTMAPEGYGKGAFLSGTLQQLKLAATSKAVVMDGYLPAVCIPARRTGTTVIQTWHAAGAIKKFGYQCIDTPAGRSSEDARIARMHENYDWVIAGGPGAVSAYAAGFNYPHERVLPLGMPHFDYLRESSPDCACLSKARKIASRYEFFENGKLNILYAPTLRKGIGNEQWLSASIRHLAEHCPAQDANLIIAGHPLNNDFDKTLLADFPNVHFVPKTATIDLIELSDCVISDYSAIALDAGLAGKPVLFYVPDIEAYRASPGLNVDPLDEPLLTASADAAEVLATALDSYCCARAQRSYAAFIDAYFEGAKDDATQRVVGFVAGKLDA